MYSGSFGTISAHRRGSEESQRGSGDEESTDPRSRDQDIRAGETGQCCYRRTGESESKAYLDDETIGL